MAKTPGAGRGRGRPPGSKNKSSEAKAAAPEAASSEVPKAASPQQRAQAATEEASKSRTTRADLEVFLREANRYAEHAAEATGELGSWTKQFVERTGLDKTAVTQFRKFSRMDEAKRAFAWKDLKSLMQTMGFDAVDTLFEGEEQQRREQAVRTLNRSDDEGGGGSEDDGEAPTATDGEDDDVRPAFLRNREAERDQDQDEDPPSPQASSNVRPIRRLEGGDAPGSYQKH